MKLAIAETSVGVLVGKAGCVIKELMQISGANIKVSQKGEVVPGTTNRCVCVCVCVCVYSGGSSSDCVCVCVCVCVCAV